jgi:Myb/SANT-like DNA-binding domain
MGWTVQQEHRLVELYKEEQADIDGTGSTVDANRRRRQAWQKIAINLNVEFGTDYAPDTAKKKFWNIKASLRSKQTANGMSQRKTGGGEGVELKFTAAEELLYSIVGATKGFTGEKHYIESLVMPQINSPFSLSEGTSTTSREEAREQSPAITDEPSTSSSAIAETQERQGSHSQVDMHSTAGSSGDGVGKRKCTVHVEEAPEKMQQTEEEGSQFEQMKQSLEIQVLRKKLEVLEKMEMLLDNAILRNSEPFLILDL